MANGKITKRSVDAMIASRSEGFLWDDGIRGFGAKITKGGAVSYVMQFRMGGREAIARRYTIGSHGSPWTLATAREEAQRLVRARCRCRKTNLAKSRQIFSTSTGGGFTGYHKGKEKLDRLIAEACGEALQPWRLHDLRRTLATGFQRLGVRFEVTEAVLNHVGGSRAGVAGIYQRHDWKVEKRQALDLWNTHIADIVDRDFTSSIG